METTQEWIKRSEQEAPYGKEVLICVENNGNRRIYIGELERGTDMFVRYHAGEGRQYLAGHDGLIRYWLPLPQLP
jgi:hypothetical protein